MRVSWIVVILAVSVAKCQTVCVREPLMAYASQPDKQAVVRQVEGWVQGQGFKTGCERAELELLMTPLQGTSMNYGSVYFVVQNSDGVGTIDLRPETYGFGTWLVQLYPMGRVRSLETRLGPSLRGNIRGVLKKVRSCPKTHKKPIIMVGGISYLWNINFR